MDYKKIFEACCKKLENHMREIPKDNPEFCACEDGKYFENPKPLDFMDIQTWMPSFFTGQALLAYEWSKEKRYLEWLEGFQQVYYDKVYMHAEETMHDLGFLYLPYAVGLYRLTGEVAYRTMALKAADDSETEKAALKESLELIQQASKKCQLAQKDSIQKIFTQGLNLQ